MNKELQDLLQGENDKIRELRNEIEKTQNQIEGVRREINGIMNSSDNRFVPSQLMSEAERLYNRLSELNLELENEKNNMDMSLSEQEKQYINEIKNKQEKLETARREVTGIMNSNDNRSVPDEVSKNLENLNSELDELITKLEQERENKKASLDDDSTEKIAERLKDMSSISDEELDKLYDQTISLNNSFDIDKDDYSKLIQIIKNLSAIQTEMKNRRLTKLNDSVVPNNTSSDKSNIDFHDLKEEANQDLTKLSDKELNDLFARVNNEYTKTKDLEYAEILEKLYEEQKQRNNKKNLMSDKATDLTKLTDKELDDLFAKVYSEYIENQTPELSEIIKKLYEEKENRLKNNFVMPDKDTDLTKLTNDELTDLYDKVYSEYMKNQSPELAEILDKLYTEKDKRHIVKTDETEMNIDLTKLSNKELQNLYKHCTKRNKEKPNKKYVELIKKIKQEVENRKKDNDKDNSLENLDNIDLTKLTDEELDKLYKLLLQKNRDTPNKKYEEMINRILKEVSRREKEKKVDKKPEEVAIDNRKKKIKKAAWFAAGFGVGLAASFLITPGTGGLILSVSRLTYVVSKKALKVYTNKHKDEKDNKIIKLVADVNKFKEEQKEKHPKIVNALAKINNFMKKPETQVFINGLATGYTVGKIGQAIYKINHKAPITNKDDTRPRTQENTPNTHNNGASTPNNPTSPNTTPANNPTQPIVQPRAQDLLPIDPNNVDLSSIQNGYVSSDSTNPVSLLTSVAKNLSLDKVKVIDGRTMVHFNQANGLGYAWLPADEVANTLGLSDISELTNIAGGMVK